MSSSTRTIPLAIARTSAAGIAGFAATGRLQDGCCRACRVGRAARQKNPLSALSRWKIFDNLRRSLFPAALTLLFLLGLDGPLRVRVLDASVIAIVLGSPDYWPLSWICSASRRCAGSASICSRRGTVRLCGISRKPCLTLVCLPYEGFFSVGAIVRTAGRMWSRTLGCWNGIPRAGVAAEQREPD